MSEHRTEIRILGASARDVLRALLEASGEGAAVTLEDGFLRVRAAGVDMVVDHLSMRADGVARLHLHDAGGLRWPADWWVYRRTSVSRGIDYEVLRVSRGERVFLEVSEDPDGHLELIIGGDVLVRVERRHDDAGNLLADANDGVTWRSLVERGLAEVAGLLGEGAAVLRDEGACEASPFAEPLLGGT